MEIIEKTINFYHLGFQICLGLSMFSLGLSVFFFWKFKILSLMSVQGRRTMKKAMKEMKEE